MVSRAKAATWGSSEADRSYNAAEVWHDVWPHTRLKEHNHIWVIVVVLFKYAFVHWLKSLQVEVAWQEKLGVSDPVTGIRFVQGIKSDDVRVLSECFASMGPEVDKLVLKLILVIV